MTGWLGGGVALGVAVLATAGLLATFYRPAPAAASAPAAPTAAPAPASDGGLVP
jgi:putative oxidoreductase